RRIWGREVSSGGGAVGRGVVVKPSVVEVSTPCAGCAPAAGSPMPVSASVAGSVAATAVWAEMCGVRRRRDTPVALVAFEVTSYPCGRVGHGWRRVDGHCD